jgi:hypothetical protein
MLNPLPRNTLNVSHKVRPGGRPAQGTLALFALFTVLGNVGCDSGPRGKDASASTNQRLSQVSVRIDLPSDGAPSVSVLAFHAEAIDVASSDVLGAVDPLVAPAPESSCELRDVAGTARAVRAQGGTLNLQEFGGIALLTEADQSLRPAPRVYPPLADVVSGVIAEAGPLDLSEVPQSLTLLVPGKTGESARFKLALPGAPSVADSGEVALNSKTQINAKGDLVLHVSGPAKTFLEIRPFGAPSALACAVASGGWVVVPHDLLVKLVATSGTVPVSFEAVWRESRLVKVGDETTRVSFEARSSAVLDLRP